MSFKNNIGLILKIKGRGVQFDESNLQDKMLLKARVPQVDFRGLSKMIIIMADFERTEQC